MAARPHHAPPRPSTLPHGAAIRTVPDRDHLGHDRQCRLGRRSTAEIQPDRAAQPREFSFSDARLEQAGTPIRLGLAAADRTDVATGPPQCLDDGRLIKLDVMRQDCHGVTRTEADLIGNLVGPADHEPIDVRESGGRRECGAAVDDDGLVAKFVGDLNQGDRDLDGSHDHESRSNRVGLHEEPLAADLDRPRDAVLQCFKPGRDELPVCRWVAERAIEAAVLVDHQGRSGRCPSAGLMGPEFSRRRIGWQRSDNSAAV